MCCCSGKHKHSLGDIPYVYTEKLIKYDFILDYPLNIEESYILMCLK